LLRIFLLIWISTIFFSPPSIPATDSNLPKEGRLAESTGKGEAVEKISFVMEAEKTEAFLHEKVALRLKLSLKGLRVKDVQYPRWDDENFLIREFSPPAIQSEWIDGTLAEIFVFHTSFSGRKPGAFKIGPARLALTLLAPGGGEGGREDYFGSSQPRPLLLETREIPIRIRALPETGKPEVFQDAVGRFTLRAEAGPRELAAGEPLRLRMIVEGDGNLEGLLPPRITDPGGVKFYTPQKKTIPGGVVFEQILIPQSEGLREIPVIRFGFFDPEKRAYRTLIEGPFSIRVERRARKEDSKPAAASGGGPPGKDLIAIKNAPGPLRPSGVFLYHRPIFWWIQAVPLLIIFPVWIWLKRRERVRTDARYAARRKAARTARRGMKEVEDALRRGSQERFYDRLFHTLRGYLKDRFMIPPGNMTPEDLRKLFSSRPEDGLWWKKLEKILAEGELARYGASEFDPAIRERTFKAAKEWIRHFEEVES
jgi:hypothetical protein